MLEASGFQSFVRVITIFKMYRIMKSVDFYKLPT